MRLLGTAFNVRSNRHELIEQAVTLAPRAAHALPLAAQCEVSVMWSNGEYRIDGGGTPAAVEHSLGAALDTLFARLHRAALQPFSNHTRIHAASGVGPRGMVLLVGEKGSGKTTLAVHLLLRGMEMLGDELVLLRDGEALTFPRRFYLRQAALGLLPGLGDRGLAAGGVDADTGETRVAIDPLLLGRSWRIRPAPVAAIVLVEPNHGRTSRVAICSKLEVARRLLAQSTPPTNRGSWLADLCRTINGVTTVTAQVGDLASAGDALRCLFA